MGDADQWDAALCDRPRVDPTSDAEADTRRELHVRLAEAFADVEADALWCQVSFGVSRYVAHGCDLALDDGEVGGGFEVVEGADAPVGFGPEAAFVAAGFGFHGEELAGAGGIVGIGAHAAEALAGDEAVEPEIAADFVPGDDVGDGALVAVAAEAAIPEAGVSPELLAANQELAQATTAGEMKAAQEKIARLMTPVAPPANNPAPPAAPSQPLSLDEQIAAAGAAGNVREVERLNAEKLAAMRPGG